MQGFFGSDVYPNPKEFLEVLNERARHAAQRAEGSPRSRQNNVPLSAIVCLLTPP